MQRLIALVVIVFGVVLADAASPALGSTQALCKNTYGGDVISAHGVTCGKARDLVRTWAVRFRRDGEPTRRVGRFDCRGINSSVEGLVIRCRRATDGARVRWYANVPE